jgi:methyl-accepting chemotaxis protein
MSRFTLTWRFSLAVGAAVITGILAAGLLLWELQATSAGYDRAMQQDEVQHQDRARVIQLTFKKQVQEWKNLLLRGYKYEDFQKYEKAFKEEEAATRTLADELLTDVKDEKARTQLKAFIESHVAMGQSYDAAIVAFGKSNGQNFVGADALVKGQDRAPTDALDQLAIRLREVVQEIGAAKSAEVGSAMRRSIVITGAAFVAVVVFLAFVVRSTQRELSFVAGTLTDASTQTAAASSQVATSAQSLSQGASEQAASLEETSASMEEMASMTRKSAENSQTAAGLMVAVAEQVTASNRVLGDMVASMSAIQESSQQVARIIKTIDEIAFQTNILALNAAVEAARAGEAGMGFAVVADEVRNLAQRSAQAAKDTAGLIEASIQKAQDGSTRVDQVAQAIGTITESVTRVKGLVDEVSVASRQQSQGIDQVSQAVAQMEKVTQTTAATAEESAAASEELSAQAASSMEAVRNLEALVGSSRGAAAPATTPAPAAAPVRKGLVVSLNRRQAPKPAATAEEQLPLGDTGTYGSF